MRSISSTNLADLHTRFSFSNIMLKRVLTNLALGDAQREEEKWIKSLIASEVMDFINDAIVSLDAFVHAYKPAAVFFSCPVEMSYGNEELLHTLARLYNSLLPSIQQGFQILFTAGDVLQKSFGITLSDIAICLKMVSMRIIELGWKVLDLCYLNILIQTIREINGFPEHVQENQPRETFLQNIEKNYKMMRKLESLHDTGWIFMDDEQFHYLSGILALPLEASVKKTSYEPIPATSDKMHVDEDAAIMESKISQIRDLFPDYGKGFLSACLEAYNQNPEENDKGKEKLFESTALSSANAVTVSGEPQTESSSFSFSSSVGRYTRKSKVNLPNYKTLDSRSEQDSAKTAALVMQYEYEDEYDDSFDDLGSVAAANCIEASIVNQAQKELIHGLGRGGNLPLGAVKKLTELNEDEDEQSEIVEMGGRGKPGNFRGRGRRGVTPGAVKKPTESNEVQDDQSDVSEMGGRGNSRGRGRGRRGGGRNYRKDQAMKKHFSGLTGF
ncbi:hypothetical protein CK203_012777 [Vitis vinifera]|uniref:CUE domain-containing protein n=1 Tax=Vitis vinifera TaxID=29760 RepID=A0A438KN47_VITVI|nr:hypothetical protein CK203_012777 [Vitis vinifera]